jgi:hypothetical protein
MKGEKRVENLKIRNIEVFFVNFAAIFKSVHATSALTVGPYC